MYMQKKRFRNAIDIVVSLDGWKMSLVALKHSDVH